MEKVVCEWKVSFDDVFSPTLGRCVMQDVQLHLKPGAAEVFRRKRLVPFRVKDRVEEELERLQMAGIISPLEYSEFAAPIVIVQKANGGLRICADYSTGQVVQYLAKWIYQTHIYRFRWTLRRRRCWRSTPIVGSSHLIVCVLV